VGMSSKPLKDADHEKYPDADLRAVQIGADAVAMVVARDVYEGGVRSLTSAQLRDIYEGRVTNWSEVGGADRPIVFFNKEPGRGTWEVFAKALYGDADDAPAVSHPEVGGNEETRSKVATTPGAMSQLSASWVDGDTVYALALDDIEPSAANIVDGTYPMARPLFLLTNGQPRDDARTLLDFMLAEEGQALVRKHGYTPLDELQPSSEAVDAED
ncbi:MAG: phosphate ABC transporter substrate-binding protein, partial [Planctomycetota bacterium]